MSKKTLKGSGFNYIEWNIFLYGKADPDTPNYPPKDFEKIFEAARPKLTNSIGKVIITGTGGELDGDFEKIFMNPKNNK